MKSLILKIKYGCLLLIMALAATSASAQIQLNNTPITKTCQFSNGGNVAVRVPTEVLTGDNISLNITLPGTFDAGCTEKVTITTSPNLNFISNNNASIPFHSTGNNTYIGPDTLSGNKGRNFNVFFKFPNYTTCNGAQGVFHIKVEIICEGDTIATCQKTLQVTARAGNYWKVKKEFMSGNLTCGVSHWRIYISDNNPNPGHLGAYRIKGTLNDFTTPTLPIVSGGVQTINAIYSTHRDVYIQNCVPTGSSFTNSVGYNLVLGDSCEIMKDTVTAESDTMASPNASLSFVKGLYGGTNLAPGCQGKYYIQVYNNGNVPWTHIEVTDNFPSGITIGSNWCSNLPSSWQCVPPNQSSNPYTIKYIGNGGVLMPGESTSISIPFTIPANAQVGDTICNEASISYQAAGTGNGDTSGLGNTPTACPGINCPVIDTAIQDTSSSRCFVVEKPQAIPRIHKCIMNPPNNLHPPLYEVGDIIHFRVNIGNSGAGAMTGTLNDVMGLPNQNLQIIPGSINKVYFTNLSKGYLNHCNYNSNPESLVPFPFSSNTSDLQNPSFTFQNMSGNCVYGQMNMLSIFFDAKVLPQSYGNKTNTAILDTSGNGQSTKTSSVKYTIDELGVLAVKKSADQEYVENGQTFNYVIEVSNLGSVGLDSITVMDPLPDCVQRAGKIVAKDAFGNIVPFTTNGNIQLAFPNELLAPGGIITATIPVQKVSGANCCDVTVSATAKMVETNSTATSRVLTATYGTEEKPAACVQSIECCDIQGVEAHLEKKGGKFYLNLTGGSVPLQEVDVTMLHYNVNYNYPDCKPDSMGIFGQLSTTTNTLDNLVLGNGPMPAGSLSWGLGAPSVINNNTIEIEVGDPAVLNIPCCKVDLTFCLKVRLKDVNCNVCEKIVCYKGDTTKPCNLGDLQIKAPRKICPGDNIGITWSGSSPSGNVDVYLINPVNPQDPNNPYKVGTGISGNSYSFTIPSGVECGRGKCGKL